MNLNAVAASITRSVNPPVSASWKVSTGYTTAPDGKRTPTYANPVTVTVDVQALDAKEIEHLDSLNIQGVLRGLWITGNAEGADRAAAKGGDLFVISAPASAAGTWLVVHVFEAWDTAGWSHVAIQKQNP